jgi:hypothetical protein
LGFTIFDLRFLIFELFGRFNTLSAVSFYSVFPAKAGIHNKKDAASIVNAVIYSTKLQGVKT